MIAFHSVCPEVAARELRSIRVETTGDSTLGRWLPDDDYAFIEYFCEDPSCDCRRVFIQVCSRKKGGKVLASINYGWKTESFYRDRMPYNPDAPREIVEGSLDPVNVQSEYSQELLELFQDHKHLDAELAGFLIELWKRICRRRSSECMRGSPAVWAASVTHVIARMNFLFDRAQPVHLTFDTICDFFGTNKTTVGSKATDIERKLRLRQHTEPGLCRREFLEMFTNVRLSNGMIRSWRSAKEMGYLPPDAKPEDLL